MADDCLGLIEIIEILHECLRSNRVTIVMLFMRQKEGGAPDSWLGVLNFMYKVDGRSWKWTIIHFRAARFSQYS